MKITQNEMAHLLSAINSIGTALGEAGEVKQAIVEVGLDEERHAVLVCDEHGEWSMELVDPADYEQGEHVDDPDLLGDREEVRPENIADAPTQSITLARGAQN